MLSEDEDMCTETDIGRVQQDHDDYNINLRGSHKKLTYWGQWAHQLFESGSEVNAFFYPVLI